MRHQKHRWHLGTSLATPGLRLVTLLHLLCRPFLECDLSKHHEGLVVVKNTIDQQARISAGDFSLFCSFSSNMRIPGEVGQFWVRAGTVPTFFGTVPHLCRNGAAATVSGAGDPNEGLVS